MRIYNFIIIRRNNLCQRKIRSNFFEISKEIGYKVGTYCNEEEIEVFEKLLEDYKYKNNLIQSQQKEVEKKDKIIDLMAEYMVNLIKYNNFEEIRDIEEIKQYFEKEAEED